jgi:predicted MFS family arabinose efflux permease
MTCRTRTGPWTPQTALRLTVLAAAAFIYVTAETVPVGALPSIARDLHVGEALVGDLLAWYALVAAVTTVPLVAWTARWTRRRALLATLICLTTSQLLSALAPNFTMLACARLLCALTHGLMWSVIAPIAARLVPASHSGRATTTIYVGTSLAQVVGNPLTAAMSLLWGWRWAVVVVTAAAALITVAAAVTLPVMEPVVEAPAGRGSAVGDRVRRYANSGMATLGVLTLTVVAGHFISYTFIVVVITDVVGVEGPRLAWLLAAFGVAGLVAMPLVGGPLDRQPKTAIGVCMAAFAAAFVVLAALAFGGHHGVAATVIGAGAIVAWGAMAMAVTPMLQSAAMRTSPRDPDGASGVYVAIFQVGIMVGSLLGGVLYERSGVPVMLAASATLLGVAVANVAAGQRLFDGAPKVAQP